MKFPSKKQYYSVLNRMIYIGRENIPSRAANVLQTINMASSFSKFIPNFQLLTNGSLFNLFTEFSLRDYFNINELKVLKLPCSIRKEIFFPRNYNNKGYRFLAPIYAKFHRPEVVYTRSLEFAEKCVKLRMKVVVELHSYFPKNYFYSRVFQTKNFLGCVTISPRLKRSYINNGLSPKKIIVEQDGVSVSDYDLLDSKRNLREKLKLPQKKWINTYSGHLYDYKGIPLILEAAKKLKEDIFLLIGGWEKDIQRFKIKSKKLGLNNVIFYGFVTPRKIPELLYASDLLLLPNSGKHKWSKDTSPLKLFEYMASGRPIIASNLENISRIIKDGKNGVIFSPDSIEDIITKIHFVKENRAESVRLSKRARRDVEYYDWDKRTKRIIKFIESRLKAN